MPIYEGQSVEDAIQNGLKALGVTQDEVQTTIIEEGKKGFLGVGKKNAQVSLEYMAKQETENNSETVNETEADNEKSSEEIETVEEVSDKEAEQAEKLSEGLDDQEALTQLGIYLTDITKELNAPATIKTSRDAGRIVFDLDTSKKRSFDRTTW